MIIFQKLKDQKVKFSIFEFPAFKVYKSWIIMHFDSISQRFGEYEFIRTFFKGNVCTGFIFLEKTA